VINPLFPSAEDSNYEEWTRFLRQILTNSPYREFSRLILIGHSLGTVRVSG
jgi:predicted alpha/beta hydrolase family esterase